MATEASSVGSASDTPEAVVGQGHVTRPTMSTKVYAPFKVYYEGDAYSMSASNATGPFDILPKHHNFLCMLVPCNLTVDTPDGIKSIKINRALLHVKADRAVVFMDV